MPSRREGRSISNIGQFASIIEYLCTPSDIWTHFSPILEPGGYIQWDDGDFGGIYAQSTANGEPHSAMDELKNQAHRLVSGKYNDFRQVWMTPTRE